MHQILHDMFVLQMLICLFNKCSFILCQVGDQELIDPRKYKQGPLLLTWINFNMY